jgi:DNA-binding HxlR family transcriptional regulator
VNSLNEDIRFNEFKKLLPGISGTVLADRLLELRGDNEDAMYYSL